MNEISELLKNKEIISLPIGGIVADTKAEFDKTIATELAFRRRFGTNELPEPTDEEVFFIVSHYINIR